MVNSFPEIAGDCGSFDMSDPGCNKTKFLADTAKSGHRFFSTATGKYVVENMAYGDEAISIVMRPSAVDTLVLMLEGALGQMSIVRNYSYLASRADICNVILAIRENGEQSDFFDRAKAVDESFAKHIGLQNIIAVRIDTREERLHWYDDPVLREHLNRLPTVDGPIVPQPFRMRCESRLHMDTREYAGIAIGELPASGERLRVLPSGSEVTIDEIHVITHAPESNVHGRLAMFTLREHVAISQGDILASSDALPAVSDQFEATIFWTAEEPMLPGRSYRIQTGGMTGTISSSVIKYKINLDNMEHLACKQLEHNEIGVCNVHLDRKVVFEPYSENRILGSFVIIDPLANATVGVGMILFSLRRADNIHWQTLDINRQAHAEQKNQHPCVLWFTGLSGAGKSTIANMVEKQLHAMGKHTFLLDGDNVRHGLNKDLGFTEADRVENIRRVAEVAKLMADAGLIVLVSFISPFRSERRMARALNEVGEFIEIFVDTPIHVAEERDPKGLYKKARRGEIRNFTGIDSPYEPPEHAEIRLDTTQLTSGQASEAVVDYLKAAALLK